MEMRIWTWLWYFQQLECSVNLKYQKSLKSVYSQDMLLMVWQLFSCIYNSLHSFRVFFHYFSQQKLRVLTLDIRILLPSFVLSAKIKTSSQLERNNDWHQTPTYPPPFVLVIERDCSQPIRVQRQDPRGSISIGPSQSNWDRSGRWLK